MLDRKTPPAIVDAVHLNLQLRPYEKYTLRNGADVYAINAGVEEVLQLELVYWAGNWFEGRNLIAASVNFLLKNGTKSKTAFQLNDHFEYYGAYLNRSCYNETATVSIHTLSKHLPALLPVLKEILTESEFPEQELETYKQNMKQRLNVNLMKSDFVAGRLIDTYLYGEEHPYGRYSRFEDFDALTRDELLAFYDRWYRKGKFAVFVSGKLPADIFQQLDDALGDLPCSAVSLQPQPILPAEDRKYRVVNDPSGVQGAIRMGTPFPNRHHPDFLKAQVLNNLFGGFFGSRLMTNIREDKGYTYGIYSYLENHMQQSAWVISTEAGRDVCEAAVTEIYKEMEDLRNEPVDDEELSLVRNYMMGSILGDLDGPFHIMSRWKNIILNGLPATWFEDQMRTIRTVSADELQALANKYLVDENFYELVVV
ncbi:M16 family metallopeptidase [Flaviaesturariibacter terrae]